MARMRLDRYLAECGCGTRSEVKNLIKKGRIELNGNIAKDAAAKVSFPEDSILLDGQQVIYEEFRYFMLNKPQGCISATRDGLSSTVLDILAGENTRDLFPVGRLDKDTEGLLLITNDGQLAHRLLSPKHHVDKTYIAEVSTELTCEQLLQFEAGLDIGDEEPTLPARIRRLAGEPPQAAAACVANCETTSSDCHSAAAYEVTIHEGRYHQIKRMFEALGSEVIFLKRISMGSLQLDTELEPGEYRRLTEQELAVLR